MWLVVDLIVLNQYHKIMEEDIEDLKINVETLKQEVETLKRNCTCQKDEREY